MTTRKMLYEQALKQGLDYNSQENWSAALGAFKAALQHSPTSPLVYAGLAEACTGLKQLDKALDCYKLAVRYSRGELVYLKKVADIQERLGQLSDASRTYMAAGELALRRYMLDEAISNWERAVRLEPHLLSAHRRLAMVFQRRHNMRSAVREYLAIARILETRGEKQQALRMCQAALRLDPGNQDIKTAVDLILLGEKAFGPPGEEVEEEEVAPEPLVEEREAGLAGAVRQMANIFASETAGWRAEQTQNSPHDPVAQAQHLAQDQLTEEILREEEENETDSGLSKLERDALLGQGIDFQMRGQIKEAIVCFERAIAGGLKLSAAYFMLGLLYLEDERNKLAQSALALAARDGRFRSACQQLLGQL